MHAWNVFFNKSPRGQGEKYLMEQLKRWADIVCACAHLICLLPANFKEGAGRQAEPKVFTIMCAAHQLLPLPRPCCSAVIVVAAMIVKWLWVD
jgi:hypothetical protein